MDVTDKKIGGIVVLISFLIMTIACGGGTSSTIHDARGHSYAKPDDPDASPGGEYGDSWTPLVEIQTPQQTIYGMTSIRYTLIDVDRDPCSVQFQYTLDDGATWNDCTAGPGGDPTSDLATTHLGVEYTFVWDTVTDDVAPYDIINSIKIRAMVSDGTLQSAWTDSEEFDADNSIGNTPATVFLPALNEIQTGNVEIKFFLKDAESHDCDVTVEITLNGGLSYVTATAAEGSETLTDMASSPEGVEHTFIWDTVADGAGLSYPLQKIHRVRITPYDKRDASVSTISTFFKVDNLPAMTFFEGFDIIQPRYMHSAVKLIDGRVLIIGGQSNDGANEALDSAEIYDPETTLSWWEGGRNRIFMSHDFGRTNLAATMLGNSGKVFVVGGKDQLDDSLDSAEIFDPDTGSFTLLANTMAVARRDLSATTLNDGRVLIVGGNDGTATLKSCELYDPVSGNFSSISNMNQARQGHTAIKLQTGYVLIIGGWSSGGGYLSTAELYDPISKTFAYTTGNLLVPSRYGAGCLLADGSVFYSGGISADSLMNNFGSKYSTAGNNFSSAGNLLDSRGHHTATLLESGKVFIFGGRTIPNDAAPHSLSMPLASFYDPALSMGAYTTVETDVLINRYWHTATLLDDGKVLIACGADENGSGLDKCLIFSP